MKEKTYMPLYDLYGLFFEPYKGFKFMEEKI